MSILRGKIASFSFHSNLSKYLARQFLAVSFNRNKRIIQFRNHKPEKSSILRMRVHVLHYPLFRRWFTQKQLNLTLCTIGVSLSLKQVNTGVSSFLRLE